MGASLQYFATQLGEEDKSAGHAFHRLQGVSAWKITGSRYLISLIFGTLSVFVLNLIRYAALSYFFMHSTGIHLNWQIALQSWLLSSCYLWIILLGMGSLSFLMTAIFRKFGHIYGSLFIALCLLCVFYWELLHGYKGWLSDIIFGKSVLFPGNFYLQASHSGGLPLAMQFQKAIPPHFLQNSWHSLFSWPVLLTIAGSGLLYIAATMIYKHRRIEF
jgi:hypothetical protein